MLGLRFGLLPDRRLFSVRLAGKVCSFHVCRSAMSSPASVSAAVVLRHLSYRYGQRPALQDVSFSVPTGKIFGLLGPNGSGKTTLFRILCTLLPPQEGTVFLLGRDPAAEAQAVRRLIGITFQSPSLDGKLTVRENLRYQALMYGLTGGALRQRLDELLQRFDLTGRKNDLVDELSGGLKRRVELAKGLLHRPWLLLLDEPSTGLDPTARRHLWDHLQRLRDEGMTILLTTHLMDEAGFCDRLGILDQGRLVAVGSPDELRSELGGEGVTIHARHPELLAEQLAARFPVPPRRIGSALRLELGTNREILGLLMTEFADEIRSLEFGKPTLEDVFLARTGHRFEEEDEASETETAVSAEHHA